MASIEKLTAQVAGKFGELFGITSLTERLSDIMKETVSLKSANSISSMKDETGDLLCSTLALCAESGWDAEELVMATLSKLERRRSQYGSLGRKLNVGILGGSFDPVTLGHVHMARLAMRAGGLDEVWFMPTYDHMYGKNLSPADFRIEMLTAALADEPMMRPFDYEVKHKMKGRMLHVMNRLLNEDDFKETHAFSVIVGMDVAIDVENWEGGLAITDVLPFVVIDRPGSVVPSENVWFMNPPHRYIVDEAMEIPAVSSTMARDCVASGRPTSHILSRPVVSIIDERKAYRTC